MQLNYTIPTDLCCIMGNKGSDKGSEEICNSWHNYTVVYNSLFNNKRNLPIRLFELGLGTNNVNIPSNMGKYGKPGASLYGWSEFFPNASIFGADIDTNILFETEKIKTYFCDQTNPHVIKYMWSEEHLREPFDIIIDDGLHTFEANVCFFENSLHKLANGGIYVIEDILTQNLNKFENKIKEWKLNYPNLQFNLLQVPSLVNKVDNNLLVIKKVNQLQFTQDLTFYLKNSLCTLFPINPADELTCVEIGSFEGKGSILIHDTLCTHEKSRLFCIDPFNDEYVKDDDRLSFWDFACKGQKHRFYNNTKSYTKIVPLQGISDDMIVKLTDNSIDFAYIDGDHSPEQVYKDAVNIFLKIKNGGIILFDDYLFTHDGVITAEGIDKFLKEYDGKYELLFKNYQLAIRVIQTPF